MSDGSELAPGVYVGPVVLVLGVVIVLLRSPISARLRRWSSWDGDLTGPPFVGIAGLITVASGTLGLAVGLFSDGSSNGTGRSTWDNVQTGISVALILASTAVLALTAMRARVGERRRALRGRFEWLFLFLGLLYFTLSL